MEKYYETEEPIKATSLEHGEMRYYKRAGRIQISRPSWISVHDNQLHHGKTVTLNIDEFKNDPTMIGLIEEVLADLKESND